jgi:two-component system response regulator AlgR
MRVLVVDDEPLARERVLRLLAEIGTGAVVGEAASGNEAIDRVQALAPDVVLMDIRMPGMDGLEAARHLARLERPPAVIFTTAYGDHALDAFDAQAVDYLVKPIKRERLAQALMRATVLGSAGLARALESAPAKAARTHFSVVVRGLIHLIPVAEVRCLYADRKYVTVVWSGGEVLIEDSLRSLEAEFPAAFMRIHRNALVSVAQVERLDRDEEGNCAIQLRGVATPLAVSRRLAADVRRRLREIGAG